MQVSIQKEVLIKAMSDVTRATSSKATTPILSGVKITAVKEGVRLVGSDGEISIERTIPHELNGDEKASVTKEGSVVLNAKFLNEIVKKLPGNDVSIEVEKNNVTKVSSGKSVFSLNGLSAEEYPNLPSVEGNDDLVITAADLDLLVKQTAFAVATSESRPVLKGINITLKDGLKAVATDSHRLAVKKLKIAANDEEQQVTIPAKALIELSRILEDPEEKIEILFTANQALFKTHNLLFYSRLLEGGYPETSRLIPTSFKTTLKVNLKEMIAALDRCSLFENRNKRVRLDIKEQQAILTAETQEVGKMEEFLEGIEVTGEDLSLSFSYKLALDALKSFSSEKVNFEFSGKERPVILSVEGDESLIQLILPVRAQ